MKYPPLVVDSYTCSTHDIAFNSWTSNCPRVTILGFVGTVVESGSALVSIAIYLNSLSLIGSI